LHLLESQPANEKAPRQTTRDFNRFEVFRVFIACPSCLAGYFTWPQVALTHHAFHRCLYASRTITVKFRYWDFSGEECLVFSVTMTAELRMTESGEANKYNVFSNLQSQN